MLTRIGSLSVSLLLCLSSCQSEKRNGQDQYTLIDDMEHSGAWFSSEAGFPGLWYSSAQCDQGNEVDPPAYLAPPNKWTFDSVEQAYVTLQPSSHAARLKTTNGGLISPPMDDPALKKWGANISVDLVTPSGSDGGLSSTDMDAGSEVVACPFPVSNLSTPPGVSLSSYSGLVFWAKASSLGDGSGEQTIHVMVHDENSEPRGHKCNNPDLSSIAKEDGSECYNTYSKTITVSESFERYEVDFSELQRDPTWGYAATDALDLEHVYMFVFEARQPKCVLDRNARCMGDASQVLKFDFSIDDLYLVMHPTNQP
jgi:hypothetical protein